MAITFSSQKKRQQIFILILIGVLLATSGFLYFGGIFKAPKLPQAIPMSLNPEQRPSTGPLMINFNETEMQKVAIDFDFFNNKVFKSLQAVEEIKTESVTSGRKNPFLPY